MIVLWVQHVLAQRLVSGGAAQTAGFDGCGSALQKLASACARGTAAAAYARVKPLQPVVGGGGGAMPQQPRLGAMLPLPVRGQCRHHQQDNISGNSKQQDVSSLHPINLCKGACPKCRALLSYADKTYSQTLTHSLLAPSDLSCFSLHKSGSCAPDEVLAPSRASLYCFNQGTYVTEKCSGQPSQLAIWGT